MDYLNFLHAIGPAAEREFEARQDEKREGWTRLLTWKQFPTNSKSEIIFDYQLTPRVGIITKSPK